MKQPSFQAIALMLLSLLWGACAHTEHFVEIGGLVPAKWSEEFAKLVWDWPAPSTVTRHDLPEGVSVLAPQTITEQWKRPRGMQHPHDVSYAWDGPDSARKLEVVVRHELPVPIDASDSQKLEVALHELIPPDPPLHGIRPLQLGSFPGFAHESLWEGMLVQRRVYVIGQSSVLLYAAAQEGDPFPYSDVFFRSLILKPPLVPEPIAE